MDVIIDIRQEEDVRYKDIQIQLLKYVHQSWANSRVHFQYTNNVMIAVQAINDFVEDNYEGTFNDFIENLNWVNGYVPYYWAWLCRREGRDISSWNIEPNPNPS